MRVISKKQRYDTYDGCISFFLVYVFVAFLLQVLAWRETIQLTRLKDDSICCVQYQVRSIPGGQQTAVTSIGIASSVIN